MLSTKGKRLDAHQQGGSSVFQDNYGPSGRMLYCNNGLSAMAHAESTHSVSALSGKQQSIIPIAAFTAKGDTEKLKGALAEGLQNGMTVNEIKEVLVQM